MNLPGRTKPLASAARPWAAVAATCAAAWLLASCASTGSSAAACAQASTAPAAVRSIDYLGAQTLPRQPGTPWEHLGGISGLEYDADQRQWLLLSDDRSEHAPARLYRAEFNLSTAGWGPVRVIDSLALPLAPGERPDPEALRAVPGTCLLAWASEGDGVAGVAPSVRLITRDGRAAGELMLPTTLSARPRADAGPRNNLSLEGLAAFAGSRTLWASMEAPLVQDGELANQQHGAPVRITRLPLAGGPAAQYIYVTDPIPKPPTGGRMRADNGVSEILQLGEGLLLVVERSGREVAEGRFAFDVRIYEASAEGATDVAEWAALSVGRWVPMRKRLLLAADAPGLAGAGNVEAAAWGPRLVDGRVALVLATDDNFAPGETTQLLFFAVR